MAVKKWKGGYSGDNEVGESMKTVYRNNVPYQEVETLAGLILEIKGDMPVKNEQIQYKHYIFEIMSADSRRIKKVKLHIKNNPNKSQNED